MYNYLWSIPKGIESKLSSSAHNTFWIFWSIPKGIESIFFLAQINFNSLHEASQKGLKANLLLCVLIIKQAEKHPKRDWK